MKSNLLYFSIGLVMCDPLTVLHTIIQLTECWTEWLKNNQQLIFLLDNSDANDGNTLVGIRNAF